jgi:hypothetical protein
MKTVYDDDSFEPFFEFIDSPVRKPAFFDLSEIFEKLFLTALGTLVPITLALFVVPAGLVAAGVILTGMVMRCLGFRGTLTEWSVLIAIGFVLVALSVPAVTPDHSRRNSLERQRQAKLKNGLLPPAPAAGKSHP